MPRRSFIWRKTMLINRSSSNDRTINSRALMWCYLVVSLFFAQSAFAASGHTVLSATSVKFYVTDAPWADVHFTVNGANQQNIRMTASGTNHEYTASGIATGSAIRYFFTIGNNSGGATDTAWVQFTLTTTTNPPAT